MNERSKSGGEEEKNKTREMTPEEEEGYYQFCQLARDKVRTFLSEIDLDLEVEVDRVMFTPLGQTKPEREIFTLRVRNVLRRDLAWTMDIEPTEDYIQNRLEPAIRRGYEGSKNSGETDKFSKQEKAEYKFYKLARDKVRLFLKEIDPDMDVTVDRITFFPDDPTKPHYRTFVLKFENALLPILSFTMEIEPSEDYVMNHLEENVRKIYAIKLRAYEKWRETRH